HFDVQTFNSQLSILNLLALLISRRVNDVEQHREEEITNQDRERRVHYRFGCRATNTDRAFARAQSFLATDEHNYNPETERFRQTHDDVAITSPAHHVRHVISAVNVEHKNRNEIAGGDADSDALCHQQGHRYHHRESARHDQIIGRITASARNASIC